MNIRVISIFSAFLMLFAPLSHAEIEISGYASYKIITNVNKDGVAYYNGLAGGNKSNYDSRENNIGLQFTTDISSKMDMTVVMSARGGPAQKYNFETEWAYVNYKLNDDLSIRVGKVKGPFYMVSDYKDVGYAYPWVSPPEEVYSTNPIRSVNGIDIVYQTTINEITYLGEVYFGGGTNTAFALPTALSVYPASSNKATSRIDFTTRKMLGFNASVSYEGISFRAGYFKTLVDIPSFNMTDKVGEFGGVGLTIDKNNIVIYSEYIIRDTGPALSSAFPDATAAYVTAGYRMGDYLPYITVSSIGKGKDPSKYTPKQTSTALGLRIEVADTASLKFEYANKVAGSYGGDASGLYDAKLTGDGQLFTVALDVIF